MIGFYYGRNPKVMQQDTVLQHSRMFGYRNEKLLSVTRFYSTRSIYESMTKITDIDMSLREDISSGKLSEGIYFIHKDDRGKVVPCSPAKVSVSNIVMLKPKKRILPVGFSPLPKTYANALSAKVKQKIDLMVSPSSLDPVEVDIDNLEEIINLIYEIIARDKDSERFISKEQFLSSLRYLAGDSKKAFLLVRMNRQLSKMKDNGTTFSDAPDTQGERIKAYSVATNLPVLMMIHQNGKGEGWDGAEFWWPVLVVQKNFKNAIFAQQEERGRVNASKSR